MPVRAHVEGAEKDERAGQRRGWVGGGGGGRGEKNKI